MLSTTLGLALLAASSPCAWDVVEVSPAGAPSCREDAAWLEVPATGWVRLRSPEGAAWLCANPEPAPRWVSPGAGEAAGCLRSERDAEEGAEGMPPPDEPGIPVVVLGLESAGAPPQTTTLLEDLVAVELGRRERLEVFSGADAAALMAEAAEAAATGCEAEEGDCLAELAGALGARLMVKGELTESGRLQVLRLTLFDSERAEVLERVRVEGRGLVGLRERLPAAITNLLLPVLGGEAIEIPEAARARTMDDASSYTGAAIAAVPTIVGAAACWGVPFVALTMVNSSAGVGLFGALGASCLLPCAMPCLGLVPCLGALAADLLLGEPISVLRALLTGGAASVTGALGAAVMIPAVLLGLYAGPILVAEPLQGLPPDAVGVAALALAVAAVGAAALAVIFVATAGSYVAGVGLFAPDEVELDAARSQEGVSARERLLGPPAPRWARAQRY